MAKDITWSQSKARYLGQVDGGPTFLIGVEVPYQDRRGLMNEELTTGQVYDPANYPQHDFWAQFIAPTAVCESHGSFHCLNTYDSAAFTFGFLQYGAHVPNGDFVQWFRGLLELHDAADWFPDLVLSNGRVGKETAHGVLALEDDTSTQALMDFLNPTPNKVDVGEIVNAAKLIGWQSSSSQAVDSQVGSGVRLFQNNMKLYARKYSLDGRPDTQCVVVADIRHQGRASSAEIMTALRASDPLDALLAVGADQYASRCATLKQEIDKRVKSGMFGTRTYKVAAGTFV